MTAALSPQDILLARLLESTCLEGQLPSLYVRAIHAHHIKAVEVSGPRLVIPIQGSKRAREHGDWLLVTPGNLLLVPSSRSLDMETVLDETGGKYAAVAVVVEASVLESARQLLPPCGFGEPGPITSVALEGLADALLGWFDALQRGETILANHAMVGVVLRLHARGLGGLLAPHMPSLSEQIRAMIAADPAREWSSHEIEGVLGMSGATLRRRLVAAGTSLRDIITGTRLAEALILLQSTSLPVKSVAWRVGYGSVASFSKRFAERYGVEPSRVANV